MQGWTRSDCACVCVVMSSLENLYHSVPLQVCRLWRACMHSPVYVFTLLVHFWGYSRPCACITYVSVHAHETKRWLWFFDGTSDRSFHICRIRQLLKLKRQSKCDVTSLSGPLFIFLSVKISLTCFLWTIVAWGLFPSFGFCTVCCRFRVACLNHAVHSCGMSSH